LLDKLIPADQRDMALVQADPDKITAADLFDELRTLPFLASRKFVLLKSADDFISDNREMLEKYFESPSACGTLIMTVNSWLKTTRIAKKLDSVGELIETGEIKPWELPDFVVAEAARNKKTITKQSAQALVELIGDQPGQLPGAAQGPRPGLPAHLGAARFHLSAGLLPSGRSALPGTRPQTPGNGDAVRALHYRPVSFQYRGRTGNVPFSG
jgi:hypothetical protein